MKLITKNCEACGDLIEVRANEHRRGWGRFCDLRCCGAWKHGMRPADITEYRARSLTWARDMMKKLLAKYPDGKPPTAPSLQSQLRGIPTRKRRASEKETR